MNESRAVGSSRLNGWIFATLGWIVALGLFFPVFWIDRKSVV